VEYSSSLGQGERLSARRRLRRRRAFFAFGILFLIVLGAIIYGLWQNSVRISRVQIFGPPSLEILGVASAGDSLSSFAMQTIQGSYFGIIPRDSIFFFPESHIRAGILSNHPEFAAVSIFRNGLTGLSIKTDNRIPVARWCGSAPSSATTSDCYFFDAKGFIYSAAASSTSPINPFIVYESFANEGNPIGSTLPNFSDLPSAFDFARQIETLGSSVVSISFRNDEVDDYLASGTRITYVLGDEQNAFTALVSARANLNFSDGSLDYVDVRFDGKMYIKRKQ